MTELAASLQVKYCLAAVAAMLSVLALVLVPLQAQEPRSLSTRGP